MAKLLKPLVVIVLLLGIAALCLQAIWLFPQRTLIKARTQNLETGIGTVVATLKGSLPEETQQALPFAVSRLQIGVKDDLPVLGRELKKADQVAKAVLQGWDDTKTDLENTRQDLENTRAELENTKAQLEDARTEIVQLNDTLRTKNEELEEKSNLIATLEDEKATLESQQEDLTAQIETLQDDMAQLEEEKNSIEMQLEKCDRERDKTITMPVGTTAKIVYANADWNFVVIDIGSNQGAQSTAEMIIYRGDNMIGKIRISAVRNDVSIAEVITDFQQDTIEEGDYVLY